jgi:hypothetical protein
MSANAFTYGRQTDKMEALTLMNSIVAVKTALFLKKNGTFLRGQNNIIVNV